MIINVLFVLLTTLNTLSKQLAFNLRSRRIDRLIRVIDGQYLVAAVAGRSVEYSYRHFLRFLRTYL